MRARAQCTTFEAPPDSRTSETRGSPWPGRDHCLRRRRHELRGHTRSLSEGSLGVRGSRRNRPDRPGHRVRLPSLWEPAFTHSRASLREAQGRNLHALRISALPPRSAHRWVCRVHAGRAPLRPPGAGTRTEVRRGPDGLRGRRGRRLLVPALEAGQDSLPRLHRGRSRAVRPARHAWSEPIARRQQNVSLPEELRPDPACAHRVLRLHLRASGPPVGEPRLGEPARSTRGGH